MNYQKILSEKCIVTNKHCKLPSKKRAQRHYKDTRDMQIQCKRFVLVNMEDLCHLKKLKLKNLRAGKKLFQIL